MADIFEIAGRIHSTSQEHVTSPADEILDTSQNKKQHLINADVARHESEINSPTNGLNKRVEDIEALAQIGDTPVETNASNIINNTSLNGKVPSASAVNGVYNAVAANTGYYECDTEGATDAKVVSAPGYVLTVGGCLKIKMTNANSVNNATLNINSTGAKALYYEGERASSSNTWDANEIIEVYYNGTSYYANNVAGGSSDGVFDVSEKFPTSGVEGGNTYTLEGALAVLNAGLSASKKKGGMSIKFVSSSDNKYVQFRYMSSSTAIADFTNVANWQGVDDEPTVGSDNLVKSGGVAKELMESSVNFTINGKDSDAATKEITSLLVGKKYRIFIENPNWSRENIGTDTSNYLFAVTAYKSTYKVRLVKVYIGGTVEDFYNFTIPSTYIDYAYIQVAIRADVGTSVKFSIQYVGDALYGEYGGIATPQTIPDKRYWYLARQPGDYSNFLNAAVQTTNMKAGRCWQIHYDESSGLWRGLSIFIESNTVDTFIYNGIFNFDSINHVITVANSNNLNVICKGGRIGRHAISSGQVLSLPNSYTNTTIVYVIFNLSSGEFRYELYAEDMYFTTDEYIFAIVQFNSNFAKIVKVTTTVQYTIDGTEPYNIILDKVKNNVVSLSWIDLTRGNIKASTNTPTYFTNDTYVLRTNKFYAFGTSNTILRSTVERQDGRHWDARIMVYNRKFEFIGYFTRTTLPYTFNKDTAFNLGSPLVNTDDLEPFFFKPVFFLYESGGTSYVTNLTPNLYTDGEIEMTGCLNNVMAKSALNGNGNGVIFNTLDFIKTLKSRGTLETCGLQQELRFNNTTYLVIDNIQGDVVQPMKLSFVGRRTNTTKTPTISISVSGLNTITPIVLENDMQEIKEYMLPPSYLNGGQIYITIPAYSAFTKFEVCAANLPVRNSGILFQSHLGVVYGKNTMNSFVASAQMGFKSCVTNLRHTLDNVLVCAHNDNFTAATDSQTYNISELTYDQINALGWYETRSAVSGEPDQKYWYDYFGGQKIVKIEEFLELCKRTGMMPIFSIHDTVFDFADLKVLTDKFGYVEDDSIMIKTSISRYANNVARAIAVFGHIAQYNIGGYNSAINQTIVNTFCTDAAGLTRWVECEGDITDANLAIILNSGCKAMLFDYQFKDTKWYRDYIKKGVIAFTVDRFYSDGLNW